MRDVDDPRLELGLPPDARAGMPDLSAGIYTLEAGATDPQQPHTEDELYYVVAGRGVMTVGAETRPVVPGSVIFVAAGCPPRFHGIAQRPPEQHSRATPSTRHGSKGRCANVTGC